MLIYTIFGLVVSLIFACNSIGVKILSNSYGLSSFLLAFIRFSIASLLLLPFLQFKEFKSLNLKMSLYMLLMGFVGVFLMCVSFFAALEYASPVTVNLIGATNPMIALLFTSALTLTVPSKRQALALLGAFLGVAVIILSDVGVDGSTSVGLGELFAIISVCCQVCYALLSKRAVSKYSTIFLSFASAACGLIFLIPFVIKINFFELYSSLDLQALMILLFIGSAGGALSTNLYIKTVKNLGAPIANMIVFATTPVFTALLSIVFFGKMPTMYHVLGGVLVIGSLVACLKPSKKPNVLK